MLIRHLIIHKEEGDEDSAEEKKSEDEHSDEEVTKLSKQARQKQCLSGIHVAGKSKRKDLIERNRKKKKEENKLA
ncbi:hypothetical protein ACROYT_G043271 [Oculina patagonica]